MNGYYVYSPLICGVIILVGIIIFIVIIAWLIGGGSKKTEVHYIQQQPVQQRPIQQIPQNQRNLETNKISYCFSCGVELKGSPPFCYNCGVNLR